MAKERDLDLLKVKEDRKKKLAQTSVTIGKRIAKLAKKITKKKKKAKF